MRKDFGAEETKAFYAAQIKATETANIIEALIISQGEDDGVFLSDTMQEWLQSFTVGDPSRKDVSRVVVPDKKYFTQNPQSLPAKLAKNGLTVEQNCGLVAEHELIHLRQSHENKKQGGTGAETGSHFFSDGEFAATMLELKGLTENLGRKRGEQITRLEGPVEFIGERLDYVSSTKEKKNKNAEAPAVMRELRRYLEMGNFKDESEAFKTFYDKIVELDRDCGLSLNLTKGKDCFLTTACVSARRLPDNCEELTVLRAFRDGYMRSLPDGPTLIERYYEIAPGLVEAIHHRPDRNDIYDEIYAVIRSCMRAIGNHDHQLALQYYLSMVTAISHKVDSHPS